jgi:hypothetical protein
MHPFGALIRPGKTRALIEVLSQVGGPLRQQFAESRRRVGITEERVWVIPTVIGDFAVGFFRSEDPHAIAFLQYSDDEFDLWFAKQLGEALAVPPDEVYTSMVTEPFAFGWVDGGSVGHGA